MAQVNEDSNSTPRAPKPSPTHQEIDAGIGGIAELLVRLRLTVLLPECHGAQAAHCMHGGGGEPTGGRGIEVVLLPQLHGAQASYCIRG